jgi:N-methylhydantoinase A
MYDILYRKPPVLIPRHLRKGVPERIDSQGNILLPLDEKQTRNVVVDLEQKGVKAIAVCLLHSYANPEHEIRVREIIQEVYPEVSVSISSDILRQFYEYERTVSAVIDASMKPLMDSYLGGLETVLKRNSFEGAFLLMRTGGGTMTVDDARRSPIHTVLSGPAGAVQGATHISTLLGYENLIVIDMGGTSFDVSLIFRGQPLVRTELELSGYKTLLPALDIQTIGAGGGSIAWIDPGNALQVGPQSAGADPGPVCYGKGGADPTLTDAAVCLGFIDPDYFLGGEKKLDQESAQRQIVGRIGKHLGLDLPSCCLGILRIIATKMTDAIRGISVERGFDPRDFALLACGGGGPLFAAHLAERMSISTVIVPRQPGNFSAWGMLMSDLVHDFSKTHPSLLDELEMKDVADTYGELERAGLVALEKDGVSERERMLVHSMDMKYRMVGHTITVPIPSGKLSGRDKALFQTRFEELHQLLYGYLLDDPVQVVNFRVRAIGCVRRPTIETIQRGGGRADHALIGERRIPWGIEKTETQYKVYRRELLEANNRIIGPAIIEEPSSTTVLHVNEWLRVDNFGNLFVQRGEL